MFADRHTHTHMLHCAIVKPSYNYIIDDRKELFGHLDYFLLISINEKMRNLVFILFALVYGFLSGIGFERYLYMKNEHSSTTKLQTDKVVCENKLGKLNLEKSRNLHESAKASQAKLSDATGWEDRQPITAGDTEDAVMSSPRQSLYRDWSRGDYFWKPSESEGGRQVGD